MDKDGMKEFVKKHYGDIDDYELIKSIRRECKDKIMAIINEQRDNGNIDEPVYYNLPTTTSGGGVSPTSTRRGFSAALCLSDVIKEVEDW